MGKLNPQSPRLSLGPLGAIIHRLFGMILVAPGAVARVFQMLARLGDVIYSFGCIVAGVILALGLFDYWFGQGGLIVFLSWAVLAAILWAIASAIRYILSGRL